MLVLLESNYTQAENLAFLLTQHHIWVWSENFQPTEVSATRLFRHTRFSLEYLSLS